MKKKKKSLLLAISATTPSTISTKPVAKKSPDVYVYKKSTIQLNPMKFAKKLTNHDSTYNVYCTIFLFLTYCSFHHVGSSSGGIEGETSKV